MSVNEDNRAAIETAREKIRLGIEEFLVAAGWDTMNPAEEGCCDGHDPLDENINMVLGDWVVLAVQSGISSTNDMARNYPQINSDREMPIHVQKGLIGHHLDEI